jgi:hypothetical protein
MSELSTRIIRSVQRFPDAVPSSPRPQLNLPNLLPQRNISGWLFTIVGNEIHFSVANVGTVDAGPFWVWSQVEVDGATHEFWNRISGLTPNATDTVVLTPVAKGHNVCLRVWVDPPTAERPEGEVYELSEIDNFDSDCVYRPPFKVPHPDGSG